MYQRILVPVDGSPTSNLGLEEAIRLATLTKGRLRLIHVIDDLSFALGVDGYGGDVVGVLHESAAKVLAQASATVAAQGLPVDTVLKEGLAGLVHVLVTTEATTWSADLIVLGTHGRRGVGRMLLGSSAENILRYASVPVLLVRAPQAAAAAGVDPAAAHAHMPAGSLAMS